MSQDADVALDSGAWEGEDFAPTHKITISVTSAEDVNKLDRSVVDKLDHQTTHPGGSELNVIADLHSLSLYHASQDWARQVPQSSCSVTRPQALQYW